MSSPRFAEQSAEGGKQAVLDDALPEAYAAWRRGTLGRVTDAVEERLLLDRIGPARCLRILDVGCGDGALATQLALEGADVAGLDASAEMIAAARRRADAAGVAVDLVVGAASDLPFPAKRFDRVVSVATLCFVDDPRASCSCSPASPWRRRAFPTGRPSTRRMRWRTCGPTSRRARPSTRS